MIAHEKLSWVAQREVVTLLRHRVVSEIVLIVFSEIVFLFENAVCGFGYCFVLSSFYVVPGGPQSREAVTFAVVARQYAYSCKGCLWTWKECWVLS